MNSKKIIFIINIFLKTSLLRSEYDLTLIGRITYADSMGRLPIWISEALKNELKINIISVAKKPIDFNDIPTIVKEIINNPTSETGKVSLLLDHPWYTFNSPADYVPDSIIKIAYSMLEATKLPPQWVEILNKKFDAIALPDKWLIKVYKNSGITVPLFVLAHGMYIEEFLSAPAKKKPNIPFIFGSSAGFWPWKNQLTLIEAFAQEFGNNKNIQLILHGRSGDPYYIKRKIKDLRATNIKVIFKSLNKKQYFNFMTSLDCYILISKGEGFSLTPREALALGLPCIISDNTAHHAICKTGYVYSVPAKIKASAYYNALNCCCGYNFSCSIKDARQALREVYTNYEKYVSKALQGRYWVKQYLKDNLAAQYLSLIKPAKVILGDNNSIEKDCIITNSKDLYEKYLKIITS